MEVITFHSYKGGAGRSTAALNTLPYLAKELGANKKSPILVLDMDLDSAGMTYLLEQDNHFNGKKKDEYDIKDFLKGPERWLDESWLNKHANNIEEHPLYKKFVSVGDKFGLEKESILFLGVDDRQAIDNNEMDGGRETLLGDLRQFCRTYKFKALVIDSSTGEQFSAILSIGVATIVVHCMRATTQFRIGTFNYLERMKNSEKAIILLPTVVPREDREINGEPQRETAVTDILERIELYEIENVRTDFINMERLGINEVDRFKWKEGVLYKIGKERDLFKDEKDAAEGYEKLAQLIVAIGDE